MLADYINKKLSKQTALTYTEHKSFFVVILSFPRYNFYMIRTHKTYEKNPAY